MTTASLKLELKKLNQKSAEIERQKEPIKKQLEKIELELKLKTLKFKIGQHVEYRLSGHTRVYFGVITAINARSLWRITYLVERIEEKTSQKTGFGNEVTEAEIFGSSLK